MLRMIDKEYIRKKHFLEGWSIHELSRQLKISRQTVRKMLKEGEIPKYNRQVPKPCPVMDPFREVIESILKVDETAPVKQRHAAARIFTRLHEEFGFNGGESTVRRYVRNLKKSKNECFLLLEANPGRGGHRRKTCNQPFILHAVEEQRCSLRNCLSHRTIGSLLGRTCSGICLLWWYSSRRTL